MSTPPLTRRRVLLGGAAAAALALGDLPAFAEEPAKPAPPKVAPMPAVFVGHGSPMLALHRERGAEFTAWMKRYPRPVAILSLSAHFTLSPITLGAVEPVPLVYDFSGFPEALYRVTYRAPGAPKLARRVRQLLAPLGKIEDDEERGHDHGTWVPLRWMFPAADVPVLSVSLPSPKAETCFRLGQALAPLRDEGVLILGSGNLTHNLRRVGRADTPVASWAQEFDDWSTKVLAAGDVDQLLDWERKAPAARTNHPTVEHFIPLLVAAGARKAKDEVSFPITGFDGGSLSRRCVAFS